MDSKNEFAERYDGNNSTCFCVYLCRLWLSRFYISVNFRLLNCEKNVVIVSCYFAGFLRVLLPSFCISFLSTATFSNMWWVGPRCKTTNRCRDKRTAMISFCTDSGSDCTCWSKPCSLFVCETMFEIYPKEEPTSKVSVNHPRERETHLRFCIWRGHRIFVLKSSPGGNDTFLRLRSGVGSIVLEMCPMIHSISVIVGENKVQVTLLFRYLPKGTGCTFTTSPVCKRKRLSVKMAKCLEIALWLELRPVLTKYVFISRRRKNPKQTESSCFDEH